MKILVVGMSDSIHAARWVSQTEGLGWDVRFFAVGNDSSIHQGLKRHIVYSRTIFRDRKQKRGSSGLLIQSDLLFDFLTGPTIVARLIEKSTKFLIYGRKASRAKELERVIRFFRPDIVHSMETQGAGYLVSDVKDHFDAGEFPAWLHTNWGSDIYLFGRLAEHEARIRKVLASCDYYSCECERDAELAREFGFTGEILPVFPNSGGFDLPAIRRLREQAFSPSTRKIILLKGYQGWAGRAFCGIRALARAKDILGGYNILIYANDSPDMRIAAELLSKEADISVTVLERGLPHQKMMELHGMARISIGLSISDAISTSFLEAMVMGSFPIQSWTSAADEWIKDGEGGILVPPEDPEIIENAIRRALSDNELVDRAMDLNWAVAENRLDAVKLRALAIQGYESIYAKVKDCARH